MKTQKYQSENTNLFKSFKKQLGTQLGTYELYTFFILFFNFTVVFYIGHYIQYNVRLLFSIVLFDIIRPFLHHWDTPDLYSSPNNGGLNLNKYLLTNNWPHCVWKLCCTISFRTYHRIQTYLAPIFVLKIVIAAVWHFRVGLRLNKTNKLF